MTEQKNIAPDTLDLDAWLAGATVAEASVDVYQRPDLLARIEELERRYERVAAEHVEAERPAGKKNPLKALEVEAKALLDELEQTRATWYVRALSAEDEKAIEDAYPMPERPPVFSDKPPMPTPRPTDAQARAFEQAWQAWQKRAEQHAEEHKADTERYVWEATKILSARGAEKIVRALSRIEVGGKALAGTITLEQAQALPDTIGEAQVGKILAAIDRASQAEPKVPAPFSQRPSEVDPT